MADFLLFEKRFTNTTKGEARINPDVLDFGTDGVDVNSERGR